MQFTKWVFLIFGGFCLIVVAAVLGAQYLYYMAAILVTLPLVSYCLGWYALRGLEIFRELPPTAWEGEEADLAYTARNPTGVARCFLSIREALPGWLVPVEGDKAMFNVPARGEYRLEQRARCSRRGVCRLGAFEITALDPLGVFAFSRRLYQPAELVVYPTPRPLRAVPLVGSEQAGWQEFTARAIRGSSVDPDGARPYVPGDPLRSIHWRQTARTGNLSVIEFEQTMALSYVLVLDLQRGVHVGTGSDSTLEYAVRFVASVAHQATQQGASLRLILSPEANRAPDPLANATGCGQSHLMRVFDQLARAEGTSIVPVYDLIENELGAIVPGATVLIVTSSLETGISRALAASLAPAASVAVVYVDPASFPHGRHDSAADAAAHEIMGHGAAVLVVRWNKDGDVTPASFSVNGIISDELVS